MHCCNGNTTVRKISNEVQRSNNLNKSLTAIPVGGSKLDFVKKIVCTFLSIFNSVSVSFDELILMPLLTESRSSFLIAEL